MPTSDAPLWRSVHTHPPRVAIVAGATGLIGRALVRHLVGVGAYDRVIALVRRAGDVAGDDVVTPVVVSFERLEHTPLPFRGADVYCCLGTTMARVKTRAAFRRIDVTYVVRLAALAQAGGAAAFGLVSALGADLDSPFFYNRCKGEAEKGVASVGLPSVAIARPSLLLGDRAEARRGERIAAAILRPLDGLLASPLAGPLRRLRPIDADTVAAALAAVVPQRRPGVRLYDPDALRTAAAAVLRTAPLPPDDADVSAATPPVEETADALETTDSDSSVGIQSTETDRSQVDSTVDVPVGEEADDDDPTSDAEIDAEDAPDDADGDSDRSVSP